jgi:hypothetical protein
MSPSGLGLNDALAPYPIAAPNIIGITNSQIVSFQKLRHFRVMFLRSIAFKPLQNPIV